MVFHPVKSPSGPVPSAAPGKTTTLAPVRRLEVTMVRPVSTWNRSAWWVIYGWLVVYLSLWKIWVRQLGWWYSQYMEKTFQTTNQMGFGVIIWGCNVSLVHSFFDNTREIISLLCSLNWHTVIIGMCMSVGKCAKHYLVQKDGANSLRLVFMMLCEEELLSYSFVYC